MLGWQNQMVNSSNPGCEVLVHGLSWILYHGEILILCWSNHCLCYFYTLLVKVMSPFLLGHLHQPQPLPTKSSSFSVKGEFSFFAMNCEIYLFDHVWSIHSPVPLFTETAQFCWRNPNDLLAKSPATSATPSEETLRWFETIATWVRGSSVAFDLGIYMVICMGSIVTIGMGFICDLMVIYMWFWPWDPGTVPFSVTLLVRDNHAAMPQTCQRPPSSESSLPTSRRLEGVWTAQRHQREWPVGDGTFCDVGWTSDGW